MAQLRRELSEFDKRNTAVAIVGPEGRDRFERYWARHGLSPLIGLPDPRRRVLSLYGQEIALLKFGRLPAQVLVDKSGMVRFAYYGRDWTDIPSVAHSLREADRTLEGH